jgi:hypothetical protein
VYDAQHVGDQRSQVPPFRQRHVLQGRHSS